MKKLYILLAFLMLSGNCMIKAQNATTDDQVITVKDPHGINENISLPMGMTLKTDSLLNLYYSKIYLKKKPCNGNDISASFSKQDYIKRLKKLPTLIEMPYNDVVRNFIDQLTGSQRDRVSYMLGAANFYIPIFEKALEAYGLPLELKYLPFVESGLDPFASKNGNSGLWQLSISTGKHYGLVINSLVDERRDPVKSSYAAAQYLKDLYKIFDDWEFVITAFQSSPSTVDKAIHRTKGAIDFWSIYPNLTSYARSCVPAFIATNYVMNYYCDHGICPMNTDLPAKTDTVSVDQDIHFQQIAHALDINIELLRELNPQYRHDVVNGNNAPMSLRLPASLIGNFIDQKDSIVKYKSGELLLKREETNVSGYEPADEQQHQKEDVPYFSTLDSRNDMAMTGENDSSETETPEKSYRKRRHRTHRIARNSTRRTDSQEEEVTVKSGETLSEIAKHNHTTVKKIKRLNGINGSNLLAGVKLKIK
ncbi:MAG: transglycosylase SLT domain-containing protein [Prevotella sp.]|nr:lytic transglycosylase domain-containing protein [Prevotella sp.]MCH3993980.1 transglycosylase SLT domain-containing protein [Prevotella sp.]